MRLVTALQDTHAESNRGAEPGKKFPGLVFLERTNTICKHFFSPLQQASTRSRKSPGSRGTGALAHGNYQSTVK